MRVCSSYATDVGRVRSKNEDNLFIADSRRVYAVADGMGGHPAGEVAARIAIAGIAAEVGGASVLGQRFLVGVFAKIHEAILDTTRANERQYLGMGTTLAACSIVGSMLHVAHAGDSLVYLIPGTDRTALRFAVAQGNNEVIREQEILHDADD